MCLAIPGTVTEIHDGEATVNYGGVTRRADLRLCDVRPGDRVLVHAGFVIQVLEPDNGAELEALVRETLDLL